MKCLSAWVIALLTTVSLAAAAQAPPTQKPAAGRDKQDIPLIEAVKKSDIATVRALLQKKANVNATEADGTTALHWAAHHDEGAIADVLIRAGANVQLANRYGVTVLSLACTNGSAPMIERLLQAGANPNTALPEGETPLMTAARTGNADAVKLLFAHGVDIKSTETWRGQDALMWAAAEGHVAPAKLLVEFGADVNAKSKDGYTALMFGARQGHRDIIALLLAAGSDVNATQAQGASPLIVAIQNAHWDIVGLLLEKGADPNINKTGFTPLHLATQIRRPEVLQFATPASTSRLDSMDVIKLLLAKGADPNARMTKPFIGLRPPLDMPLVTSTPFFLAARVADAPVMRLLVERGADPLAATKENATPLMAAAGVGYRQGESPGTEAEALEAVMLAVELGAKVNAANSMGFTALHGAAIRGANSVIRYLVEKGANINAKDKIGRTPFVIADEGAGDSNQRRQLGTAAFIRDLMGATK